MTSRISRHFTGAVIGLFTGALIATGSLLIADVTFNNPEPIGVTIAEDDPFGTTIKVHTHRSPADGVGGYKPTITLPEGTGEATVWIQIKTDTARPGPKTLDFTCDPPITCSATTSITQGREIVYKSLDLAWPTDAKRTNDRTTGKIKATWST